MRLLSHPSLTLQAFCSRFRFSCSLFGGLRILVGQQRSFRLLVARVRVPQGCERISSDLNERCNYPVCIVRFDAHPHCHVAEMVSISSTKGSISIDVVVSVMIFSTIDFHHCRLRGRRLTKMFCSFFAGRAHGLHSQAQPFVQRGPHLYSRALPIWRLFGTPPPCPSNTTSFARATRSACLRLAQLRRTARAGRVLWVFFRLIIWNRLIRSYACATRCQPRSAVGAKSELPG